MRDTVATHIGTHGTVQLVDVFTLPETDGIRRVVILDKMIPEYTEHLSYAHVRIRWGLVVAEIRQKSSYWMPLHNLYRRISFHQKHSHSCIGYRETR